MTATRLNNWLRSTTQNAIEPAARYPMASHRKCSRQILRTERFASRPTATAVNPEFRTKYTSVRHASGPISDAAGRRPWASGPTPVIRKKTCAAVQMESAGAAMLKATRSQRWPLRQESTPVSVASTTAAAPGPKSSAVAIENVSATEMLAETNAMLTAKEPVTMPQPPSSIHCHGCDNWIRVPAEWTSVTAPARMTSATYTRSARGGAAGALVGSAARGSRSPDSMRSVRVAVHERRAPDDRVLVARAPDDGVAARVPDRRAPDDLVLAAWEQRDWPPHKPI